MQAEPASPHDDLDGEQIRRIHRIVGLAPPTLRRDDVAARGGVDLDSIMHWWRAMGFPEVDESTVMFNAADVDMVARLVEYLEAGLFTDEGILRVTRLLGASMQRIAESQVESAVDFVDRAVEPGVDTDGDDPIVDLLGDGALALIPMMESALLYVWRRHLLAAIGHRLSAPMDSPDRAVGFADLSGFTKLSKQLSPDDLASLVDAFEATAFDVASGLDARVVKLIGDEVMFVAADLPTAARVALILGEQLARIPDMPPVHCGLAFGPTVNVGGDVFGNTVNLAARLTTIARRGSVVIPRSQAVLLADQADLTVRTMRRVQFLKGIGDTATSVVRLAEPPPGPDPVDPDGDPRTSEPVGA
ncbi:MAG: adenylate cyclase regulatory domain-containing protein [Microthrixaceae bacterium]